MKLMLKHKIMGMAFIAALLPTVLMLLLAELQRSRIGVMVTDDLSTLVRNNIKQLALDAYHSCEASNEFILQQVTYNLNVAEKVLKEAGPLRLSSEKAAWVGVNQYTESRGAVTLPKMTVGGLWLGPDTVVSDSVPVVDNVQNLVGGACTIFQRMNEQGDMMRVATTIRTNGNKRAVGTFIPATHADGIPDPVISVIMRGETFHGRAYVVDDWYLSAYKPLQDAEGKLIGMLYVGIEQNRVSALRNAIIGVRVGDSGHVFVLGGKGQLRGRVIVSGANYREGSSLWEARDPDGKLFVQSIVNQALTLHKEDVAFERYKSERSGSGSPMPTMAAIAYYEPWDWIIIAAAYEEEFNSARNKLDAALNSLFLWSVLTELVVMGMALSIALLLTRKVTVPIERITSVARRIAQGDLKAATESFASIEASSGMGGGNGRPAARDDDETGQLLESIQTMTQSLNSLVGQVKQSSIQLVSASTEIAAAAKQQEVTVSDFGASTSQVVAASREISATSQELLSTMNDVAQTAGATASLAGSGRSTLAELEANMRQLADATRSISHKLAVISDKANNINSVITTITKVADETNLLSLNAAIEAEKAGEYGLGFSVVAREIRRLADQTAVATLDIEQMVKEMRSAVSAGVMEMDKFTEEVRLNVSQAGKISGQLETIIEQVQALKPRFESVNHGMEVQAQGAQQISKAMTGLNDAARQTADSLREFNKATDQLNEAARGLRSEVSRFNVGD